MARRYDYLRPKQLKAIEIILAKPAISNTALAEEIGVNRNTITEWKRDELFQAEMDKRLKEQWKDAEAIAVQSMRKLATEGNFQASKYILDSLGYAPAQKIEADVRTEINLEIED